MRRVLLLLAITSIIGVSVALSTPAAEAAEACDSLGSPIERAICIEKVVEPSVGVVGEPLTFTITVSADPRVTASGYYLIDYLPEGVDFVSAAATQGECTYGIHDGEPRTVRCGPYNLGHPNNQTQVVTIKVVPTSPGSYVNVARHAGLRVEEPFEVREPAPSDKEDCKHGGYKQFGFKNQGQCIKAVKNHATPVDTTAPETTITAGPEQNSHTQNESVTFEFTSSEPNSTFECQAWSDSFGSAVKGENLNLWHPCASPMTYSPLRDDNITVKVRAKDAAGNVDPTPAERIFTVQRPGPSLQITNGPAEDSTINAGSVTFEWTSDGATPVDSYCQLHGPSGFIELFDSCSSPETYQLTEDGFYWFNVFVEDATGNSTNMRRDFIVDADGS